MASLKSQLNITLYRGFLDSGAYVWSPFVTKLEARLRFAGLAYKTEPGSLQKAPRGKIPYIAISKASSEPPTILADTTLICESLIENGLVDDLNADLSLVGKAQDLAFRALLEDKLYFYQVYERWHQNYYTMRQKALAALPYPMQIIIGVIAYRKTWTALYGQGTARFSPEEISSFKEKIWESVNALLVASKRKTDTNDTVFWLWGGDAPTDAETTLYGFVASGLVCDAGPESRKIINSYPVVVDYARRIHDRYFADYALWE